MKVKRIKYLFIYRHYCNGWRSYWRFTFSLHPFNISFVTKQFVYGVSR
jgi:hypothetical protein